MTKIYFLLLAALPLFGQFPNVAGADGKPNIVLIMADDMGFSDIGCYGSEIPTPNLDALAANGLRFTQFHNTARCSPTRASLLTGLHPHQAGMGRLAEGSIGTKGDGAPGYLGYLNNHCVTIAEVLRPAGYRTYLAGKWHLGMRDESKWPLQRGFDRFYGLLVGASSYFRPEAPRGLTLDNEQLPTPTDPDYYTTDAFTDFAIQTVNEHKGNAPFFLYLAFNAPHWPLHAKEADIQKFVGKYKAGWDKLREERLARQKQLGIVAPDVPLSERDPGARAWDALSGEDQQKLDYRMAVYAAQVHCMDYNVGRLVQTLRDRKLLDNTLIVFLSDNGACAEPYTDLGGQPQENINKPSIHSNVSYGTGWANLSNIPFRRFKSMLHEGGLSSPLIVHWPAGLKTKPGSLDATPGFLPDIMPTFIDVSGASYPEKINGQAITPLEGRSLLPILAASGKLEPRLFCWEQYGFKAVRDGNLKAVFSPNDSYDKLGSGKWELYDLASDRAELHDLAAQHPEKLQQLIGQWDAWAARAQVSGNPNQSNKASGKQKKKK